MALRAAIELGILKVMAEASKEEGSTLLTSGEIAARLCAKNPDAPALIERGCLLATQSLPTPTKITTAGSTGTTSRPSKALASLCNFNFLQSSVSAAPSSGVACPQWRFLRPSASDLARQGVHGAMVSPQRCSAGRPHPLQQNRAYVTGRCRGRGTGANLSLITAKYLHIKGTNFNSPHVIEEAPKFAGW
ncbi:hypothetical protein EJ110_NYTH39121 [Nymphaea thermarum]|nr:hypothetical protein EJ110_NYTH39121 [Nymphaea thermarum]